MICQHLYLPVTLLFSFFPPLTPAALAHVGSHTSTFLSLTFICFFLAGSSWFNFRSSSQQMPIFLCDRLAFSLVPTPTPFSLPPSFTLTLPLSCLLAPCVRVCRWLSLAGSVTRGNWGRVHFNRTNGNKLIHSCCCFLRHHSSFVSKRAESCEVKGQ